MIFFYYFASIIITTIINSNIIMITFAIIITFCLNIKNIRNFLYKIFLSSLKLFLTYKFSFNNSIESSEFKSDSIAIELLVNKYSMIKSLSILLILFLLLLCAYKCPQNSLKKRKRIAPANLFFSLEIKDFIFLFFKINFKSIVIWRNKVACFFKNFKNKLLF